MTTTQSREHGVSLGVVLAVLSAIGLYASGALALEYLRMTADDSYVASCDINEVLSCSSVMETPTSTAIGDVPNPFFGIAGFAALAAVGVCLVAGARLAGWFWFAAQVGVTLATIFVHWMFWESVFVYQLLCPYCLVVWVVTIPMFVWVTGANLKAFGGIDMVYRWRWLISAGWLAVIAAVVVTRNAQYLF